MWIITVVILIRIGITLGMSIYSFWQCFRQEDQSYTDISYLFGLFFLGLAFGKSLDLLFKLIYFTADEMSLIYILKVRYILIILTSAPLIFIGINFLIKINSNRYKKIIDTSILLIILVIQTTFVLLGHNLITLQIILIFIHLPSLIWIIFTFVYVHKMKKITRINSLIIAIAFLIDLLLYMGSVITSPSRQKSIGFSPLYIILAELIDLSIIVLIFIGFSINTIYKKQR